MPVHGLLLPLSPKRGLLNGRSRSTKIRGPRRTGPIEAQYHYGSTAGADILARSRVQRIEDGTQSESERYVDSTVRH